MFRTTEESHPRNGSTPSGESRTREFRRAMRSWSRNTFNREQMVQSLKSLAWVVPLSILVWVYAERQQIRPAERRSIPFEIRTNDPRQVVEIISPSEKIITADIEGPQALLEDLTRNLEPSSGHPAVIVLPDTYASGKEHFIPASRIRETELFRNSGVLVSDESPPTLRVMIDKLVDVEVDVRPPVGMDNFVSPPVFTPPRVKLTLPQTLRDKASADEPLVVYADLGRFDQVRTPGQKTLNDVPLLLPTNLRDKLNVTITPERVTATVDVRNTERQSKIDSLPIWPLYPPNVVGKWVVKMDADEFVRNVPITGPRDLIDQIDAGTIEPKPKAVLEVSRDDIGKTVKRKLRFDLPPGVKVSDEFQTKEVTFTLVEAGGTATP